MKVNNKPSEIKTKITIVKAHLIPFFGDKPLDKISNLMIEEYKADKIKRGLKNKSINNHLTIISKCLKSAVDWEIITSIPKIKPLKVQPQNFKYLTQEESQRLLDASEGVWYSLILTALNTGLRLGELMALSWEDINLRSKILTVTHSISAGIMDSTKSNKIRHIPLTDKLGRHFETMPHKRYDSVFTNREGNRLTRRACDSSLGRICRKAGLRKIGYHTLRHTFASRLAEKGVSIISIKELLGHSDIKTTMRYAHLSPIVLREAIKLLDEKGDEKIGHNMVTTVNFSQSTACSDNANIL